MQANFSHKKEWIKAIIYIVAFTGSLQGMSQIISRTALSNDTLYIDSNRKVYVGQYLYIGKGSDINGWFQYIGLKGSSNFISLIGPNPERETTYLNSSDPWGDKTRNMIRDGLISGDSMRIKKIKRDGNIFSGKRYVVILTQKGFPRIRYICNIRSAIEKNELLISKY